MSNLGKRTAGVRGVCGGTGGPGALCQAGGGLPFPSRRGLRGGSPSPGGEALPLREQQPRRREQQPHVVFGGTGQNACARALFPLGRARQKVDGPRRGAALLRGRPAGLPAGTAALGLARDDQDGQAGLEIQKRAASGQTERRSGARRCSPRRFR